MDTFAHDAMNGEANVLLDLRQTLADQL